MSGANVFNRLSFNFDTSKFGEGVKLSQGTKDFLNTSPIVLTTWQKSDLANGTILITNYYKNPVMNVLNQLKSNVYNVYNTFSSIYVFDSLSSIQANTILNETSNLIIQIDMMKSHTNNVSGVTSSYGDTVENTTTVIEYPDYEKAIGLGRDLVMLLNATDGIQNATPVLGSMTSLFVKQEIESNSSIMVSANTSLNNTIRFVIAGEETNRYSNITVTAANTLLQQIQTANTLIGGRRTHDWNFYREGLKLMEDYTRITKLEDVGQVQEYLIKNLIGTQSYIDKITANT